ncbi:MAG: GTPase, partial [Myxococcota bacterium]
MSDPAWKTALGRALAAADGLADTGPLRDALRWLEEPWRIVVIGRVAAGKTTWINAVTGGDRRTGLGGITEHAEEVEDGSRVYIDTPGIDDPDRAIVALQPLVDGGDAAVWIVDGLQPLTASERDVAAVVLGDLQLSIVVTKADLVEEADRAAVLARVRDLTTSLAPVSVTFANARELPRLPGLPGPPHHLSARRRRFLVDAVAAVRQRMPDPPPDRADVEAHWGDAVRGQVQDIEAALQRGALRDVGAAMRALGEAAEPARRALRTALPSWLLPVMPAPDTDPGSATTSGPDAARRALTGAAARWLAEGQLVLREWWAEGPEPVAAVVRHERLVAALDALDAH